MAEAIREVLKGIYCVSDSCNVYVVKKGDRAVLIDFGTGRVMDLLKETGIRKVEAVLLTHHHRDQAEGLQRAVREQIPVFVPETEYGLVAEASHMWQAREIYNNYNNRQDRFSILESVPAQPLRDYEIRSFGGMDFFILPTPGHTTGSISIVVETGEGKTAFTGDLVYAPGKVWSLAATQWSYNGGEGIPYTILSLLDLSERDIRWLLPSHGEPMETKAAVEPTVDRLARLRNLRGQNPRLFQLRERPYEKITEHVLFNRTSMANSYVLLSESGKALMIDFGYDFMAGPAFGTDRSARRPWLYTIPSLMREFGVSSIDACIPTHYHDDHVAGINLLKRVYGTKVICPEEYADILEHPDYYDIPCLWYEPISIDRRVKCGQPFRWEEYEITPFALSGHTRFAAGFLFEADGQRFLCTGDQYSGGDGRMPNYVYKNIFDYSDFSRSAQLYETLRPDWILSGHWPWIRPDQAFFKALKEDGEQLEQLHRQLLPENGERNPGNDFHLVFFPYQKEICCGESFQAEVKLLAEQDEEVKLSLLLPEGFLCEEPEQPLQKGERSCTFTVKAPQREMRRARIGCRMWTRDGCLGTQAEMLVTVKTAGGYGRKSK